MTLPKGLQVGSERRNGTAYRPGVGVLLSEVVPQRVEWLWTGRVPKGKLTLLEGDPGTGKSAMIMDLAARVSTGRDMPDGTRGSAPAGVVILSAEDGLADTVRPRLDAAGGDASRVLGLATESDAEGLDRLLSLPSDIPLIEQGVERVGAELVAIDPLVAFFDGNIDSHRDQDVRRVMAALTALAERTGTAVLMVRHLTKTPGGNPMYRGGGSIGIIAAARSGLLVAKDPEDEARRVLAVQKGNLAKLVPSLAFSLEEAENAAVRATWRGESPLSAGQLLAANYGNGNRTQVEKAKGFLTETLEGGAVPAKQILERGEEAGYPKRTLERAKRDLGVISVRQDGGWAWTLPDLVRRGHDDADIGDLGDVVNGERRSSAEPTPDAPDLPCREEQDRQGCQERHHGVDGDLDDLAKLERGRERYVL